MAPIYDFPEAFKRNVLGAFPNGSEWLKSLPDLIAECEARWHLQIGPPFTLSFNYVAPAETAGGQSVVVKLGVPNRDLSCEVHALQAYAGNSAVRLLDSDEERGMLLLERIAPGHTLSSLEDDEMTTREAARVMRGLWRPLPSSAEFPTAIEWASGLAKLRTQFDGGSGPFPGKLVDQAESLFRDLFSSSEEPMLLHGDLHHGNILAAQRRPWLAIDPKGVCAEPAYEVGAFLRNPEPRLFTNANIQRRRIEILHEGLGFAKERMLGWGVAQAVLAAWWSFDDSGTEWQKLCACAETLASLLGQYN